MGFWRRRSAECGEKPVPYADEEYAKRERLWSKGADLNLRQRPTEFPSREADGAPAS